MGGGKTFYPGKLFPSLLKPQRQLRTPRSASGEAEAGCSRVPWPRRPGAWPERPLQVQPAREVFLTSVLTYTELQVFSGVYYETGKLRSDA